ncbi:hypothetical protein BCON_0141g00050 [Botryotinia convoluta]|uniref:Uncharacterized protein n=1 Tax=Botryotinia convoluta TaxID=54673 RepID=A0A4Z1HUJ6_9HELO|nr:hypothetical protein BCON_0141g00050 [Botryotinia convoluta]
MLITQPSALTILLKSNENGMFWTSIGEAVITVPGGVKMGMLFDYLWGVVGKTYAMGRIGFDWRGYGEEEDGKGKWDRRVRVQTVITFQCCEEEDEMMRRVRSQGHRKWGVEWKGKERRGERDARGGGDEVRRR